MPKQAKSRQTGPPMPPTGREVAVARSAPPPMQPPNKPTQQVFGQLVPPGGTGIELVVMESVSPAYVPRVSVRESTKRRAAYAEAGYPQLSARASAYGWKRQQWFEACFARVLSPEERSKRFGERDGDLLDEEE